jgi:hypothetical protein
MFVVKYCVRDYGDVWKTEVARFQTEEEACAFADDEGARAPFKDTWYEVEEEET